MTIDADPRALQEFRRNLFGPNSSGETMPPVYLAQLKNLVDNTDASLGIRRSATERSAFWLNGRTLGYLSCTGLTDADAETQINGLVLRLDGVARIDIDVKIGPAEWGFNEDGPRDSGRILRINGETLLDASPGSALPDKRAEIEQFIDQVLAAFAG
jgi:hypothetical protein